MLVCPITFEPKKNWRLCVKVVVIPKLLMQYLMQYKINVK